MATGIPNAQVKGNEVTRQSWPAERKVKLLMEGMHRDRSVAELCREAGISRACYYQWWHEFMDAGRTGLGQSEAERHALEARIRRLDAENADLRIRMQIFQDLCMAD